MDARPELLAFVRLLRDAGVAIPTGQVVEFTRAAAALAPLEPTDLYWAGRTTLISHHEDLPTYDAVFRAFFDAGPLLEVTADGVPDRQERLTLGTRQAAEAEDGQGRSDGLGLAASERELLRARRFDMATEAELRAMRRLMARIPLAVPHRLTRRTEGVRRGRVPDLRRSVRRAIQTDGELIHRAWRRRRSRPRPLVLVLDVSGSMAGYARALLQFAYSARRQPGRVEVFCFGTRLTRITGDLAQRDTDRALAAAAERVVDWEGGTLIGASLATLNHDFGRRGLLRGAVVVICSDGLERGDPEQLRSEMTRLARYAHRVVWVNPLKGDPGYEPLQRGIRVALPSVDRFVAGHNLASLDELATVVGALR